MRRVVILMFVGGMLVVTGGPAHGCSCASGDPRTALAQADAAFVGRLVSKDQPTPEAGGVYSSGQQVTYTFRVERSVKGELGKTVEVEAAVSGASCGLEVGEGESTGLLLYKDGDHWESGLCSQMDPETLIRAASPLPAPASKGPVALVVGGRYGEARSVALDRTGKTVAYGFGPTWDTTHISVCPGSRAIVEWGEVTFGKARAPIIAVRRIDRFESAEETELPELRNYEPNFNRIVALSCREPDGRNVLVAVTDYGAGSGSGEVARGRVVRVKKGKITTLYSGTLRAASFSHAREMAYVTGGTGGQDVFSIDLSSRRTRKIARIPRDSEGLALSPGELRLAAVAITDPVQPNAFRISVVDLTRKPAQVRSLLLRDSEAHGGTIWADDETVVFVPGGGGSDRAQVFNHRLLRLGSFTGWNSSSVVASDGRIFGVGWGKLLVASLPRGPTKTLATFDTNLTYALAFVPPIPKTVANRPPNQSPDPLTPSAIEPSPTLRALKGNPGPDRALSTTLAAVLALAVAAFWALARRRPNT